MRGMSIAIRISRVLSWPLLWALAASCAATSPPSAPTTAATPGANLLPGAGTATVVPSKLGFVSLEGPYWVTSGNYLLFSDVVEANGPGAVVYKYEPASGQISVLPYPVNPGAGPTSTNGLAIDRGGALLACERYNARLVRIDGDPTRGAAKLTVLADRDSANAPAGSPFNAPNDLVVRADDNIYFTDSDWGARPGVPHGAMGVFRYSPQGQLARVLTLEKPNGIALSPDGATLYVGSDVQAKVWKLPVDASGAVGSPTLLIDGAHVPGGFKVPDGICIDDAGTLYVTNNAEDVKAIVAFDNTGRPLGRISLPSAPSNCTFGGADRRTMYVTTLHAVYQIPMPTPGLP
jgi:gluconolactonase